MCHTNVSIKCVHQMCHTNVFIKCVKQMCHTNVSIKCVIQMCPSNVSYKCVHQMCHTNVSIKCVIQKNNVLFESRTEFHCTQGAWMDLDARWRVELQLIIHNHTASKSACNFSEHILQEKNVKFKCGVRISSSYASFQKCSSNA